MSLRLSSNNKEMDHDREVLDSNHCESMMGYYLIG